MKKKTERPEKPQMKRFASVTTQAIGSTDAFLTALVFVVVWALTGPIFNFSETWQLVINTGTTIITMIITVC